MSDTIQSAIDECDMCDWGQDGSCHEVKRNCPRKTIQSAATNNIGGFLDSLVDLISEDAGQEEWIKAGELLEARDAAIRADEARKQAQRYAACVETQSEYIKLLTFENGELLVFAEAHGCRSTQYDAGVNARARIDQSFADLEAPK
jgi:hypothetical protein